MNIVVGRISTYSVDWSMAGLTHMVPGVSVRRKFLGFPYWDECWSGKAIPKTEADAMTDMAKMAAFRKAVADYEEYLATISEEKR